MKTVVILLTSAFFYSAITSASEMMTFEGTVTTDEGITSEGMLYSFAKKGVARITPIPETITLTVKNQTGVEQQYDIETSKLEKVIYSGQSHGTCNRGNDSKTSQIVVLRSGKQFEQITCGAILMPNRAIYISARHPITGELSYDRIEWRKVKEIRLKEASGQVRKDSLGHTFPSDYLYSPYTGERMPLESI